MDSALQTLPSTREELAFDILHRPDFALLRLQLRAGQKVMTEPSAMATMDNGIEMKAGLRGGLGRSLGRLLGGENLIINTFTARQAGELMLAPAAAGDVVHHRLRGGSLMLQRGAFVAHGEGVELTAKWQGARGFFGGEGLILLRASGNGDVFFNSYGGILPIDVSEGYLVDTGYIVAFEDTLQYEVTVMPGLRAGSRMKAFLFGGEGLVCRFRGQGRVWIQTRDVRPFLRWVNRYRPVRSSN